MAEAEPQTVDLLGEIHAALDELEPLLRERTVDIEMARLSVLVDPPSFRAEFTTLVRSALADLPAHEPFTVRVARAGRSVRIRILHDGLGTDGDVSMTVALPAGSGNTADA